MAGMGVHAEGQQHRGEGVYMPRGEGVAAHAADPARGRWVKGGEEGRGKGGAAWSTPAVILLWPHAVAVVMGPCRDGALS